MLSRRRRASSGDRTGVLPFFTTWRGTAYGSGRIDTHDLTDDEPVEEMTDRGQARLDRWRRVVLDELLYISGDMNRLHRGDRRHARERAPGQKFLACLRVGSSGVRVANVGREELEEAHAICSWLSPNAIAIRVASRLQRCSSFRL
jgi:hypothetical protein